MATDKRPSRCSVVRAGTAVALVVWLLVVGTVAGTPSSVLASAQTTAGAWTIDTVAGTGASWGSTETEAECGIGGPATSAHIGSVTDVEFDGEGNLYIGGASRVRMVDTDGIITTVAGTGVHGYSGDGGPATSAEFRFPYHVAVDAVGNLYISDGGNHRVRMMDTDGIITTVAGTGTAGYSGDGGPAEQAQIRQPGGLAVDPVGNLYIADTFNNRIRMVDTDGIITTVAGTGVWGSFSGDGGQATEADFNRPSTVDFDAAAGSLYIADYGNRRIRVVDSEGIVTTVAGGGDLAGTSGDGGPATSAWLYHGPTGVAVQGSGNFFRVRLSWRDVMRPGGWCCGRSVTGGHVGVLGPGACSSSLDVSSDWRGSG